ncbi:MAG: hypothetical protein ACRDTO_02500 [Mycobacterium sp.]
MAAVAAIAGAISSPATSARAPTKAEFDSLKASISRQNGGAAITLSPASVSVSTASARWLVVRTGVTPFASSVYRREGKQWHPVGDVVPAGKPADGLCAYAPASVIADLFRTHCPPYRALHARRAPQALRKELIDALLADPTIRADDGGDPSLVRSWNACWSRLDPAWASIAIAFPDTGLFAWFHRTGTERWRVFLSWRLPYPPRAPVLALASCVGYNAAEFGA